MANRIIKIDELVKDLLATAERLTAEHGWTDDQRVQFLYSMGSSIGHAPYSV